MVNNDLRLLLYRILHIYVFTQCHYIVNILDNEIFKLPVKLNHLSDLYEIYTHY